MKHKGYVAHVEFDQDDNIFVGRVVGIRDGINFHGESVKELETAFSESVDNYLAACEELGQEPNRPYSGKLQLRVRPEIHDSVAAAAEASGESINKWASKILEKACHSH
jgi:predicted HicB family RNase H-like nuclease